MKKHRPSQLGEGVRSRAATRRVYESGDFLKMLESQKGCCPICRRILTRPVIDHDHRTEAIRSVTCMKCNLMIGLADDDPIILRQAAEYLDKWRS